MALVTVQRSPSPSNSPEAQLGSVSVSDFVCCSQGIKRPGIYPLPGVLSVFILTVLSLVPYYKWFVCRVWLDPCLIFGIDNNAFYKKNCTKLIVKLVRLLFDYYVLLVLLLNLNTITHTPLLVSCQTVLWDVYVRSGDRCWERWSPGRAPGCQSRGWWFNPTCCRFKT